MFFKRGVGLSRWPHVIFLTAAFAMAPSSARTQEMGPAWTQAMNNLAHEYAQCAAYFLVVSVAMENSDQPESAKSYKDVSDRALAFAATFAEEAGLLPESTRARYELEFRAMADRIDGNTSNISILANDHATSCLEAMENSEGRMVYWLERFQ